MLITLANVDQFSKFFHQLICKEIFYLYVTKISTTPALCCYATLWKLKIKNVTDFDSILNKLLTCSWRLWGLDSTFNSSYTDCLNTTDIEWLIKILKFVRRLESTIECCCIGDFFTMIFFSPSSFFLHCTSYVVQCTHIYFK